MPQTITVSSSAKKQVLIVFIGLLLPVIATAQPTPSSRRSLQKELQSAKSTLRDWPDLARYQASDKELGPVAKGEARVVFLGDSITEGWDMADFFPGKPYVNRGISGQTTPQILLRFRQDVIALQPKAVVILAGTNDIAENTGPITIAAIEDNLMSMAELARANGIRVVLSSVLPAAAYWWQPHIQPAEKILALNTWMKEYAEKEGFVFLDYYSTTVNTKRGLKDELTTDGVHPNRAGYALMRVLAEKAITDVLGRN